MPDETFNYDSLGNRLRRDGQTTNATFNQANRLLEDQEFLYEYDDNGNLIKKTEKSTAQFTQYTYDAENQLIHIDFPGGTMADYHYDGLGRRIAKDVNGTVTGYVYDAEDIFLEFDTVSSLAARYTHGEGINEPLIMERDLDSTGTFEAVEKFFYHTDGLGSVTDLVDSTTTIFQSYVYDSFGRILQQNGSLKSPYTYTGRDFDEESKLYFYRSRYYDPKIGRFLQEDPIGFNGGINFYVYVRNNPIRYTDPFGLLTKGDCDTLYEADIAACQSLPFKKDKAVCYAEAADVYAKCLRNADEYPDPNPDDNNNFCPIIPNLPNTPNISIPPFNPGPGILGPGSTAPFLPVKGLSNNSG
jgi:RHS repeat-associated protein